MKGLEFKDFFTQMSRGDGNFERHIANSIPGYSEMTYITAQVVAEILSCGGSVLDIGSSEGYWGDEVVRNNPVANVYSLDPNPDMVRVFEKKHLANPMLANNKIIIKAFGDGFFDGENHIESYYPVNQFDIVRESMTFQFISADREAQYKQVKQALKKNGLFVTNSKNYLQDKDAYDYFESLKDDYKKQFFSEVEIKTKAQTILPNMGKYMVQLRDTTDALKHHFEYVHQYWVSGNFHGFIASDSVFEIFKFVHVSSRYDYRNRIAGHELGFLQIN